MRLFLPSVVVLALLMLGNEHWSPSAPVLKKIP
jgi:hypothetical protein